jgi:tetratricopeptide (TPR) repeat protein
MAKGLLGGLLGGDGPANEDHEAASGDARSEGLALAAAMDLSRSDPEVARKTAAFMDAHTRLLLRQEAQLAAGQRHHAHEGRMRRIDLHIRLGLQVLAVIIATAIGLGIALMIHDAFAARSVIVEAFDAPPALAARGLSGKVVAGALLDELTRLQIATRTDAAKRNLTNAWTSDIKVEVPQTGVSIGEIDRLLKARFGHELHIGGDLVQADTGGLILTVRGDGVAPRSFTGAAGDLAKLTTEAAEYIYGQSQPALFAGYLAETGRNAEAVASSKAAFGPAAPEDRPYLLNAWANALLNLGGSPRDALPLYRLAIKLKPDYWIPYNNVMNSLWLLGHEEGAWRAGEALRKAAGGRPGRAPETVYENQDILTWNLQASRAAAIADAAAHGGVGATVSAEGPQIADIDARLHDPADAEFQLQTTKSDANDPTIAALTHFVHGRLAAEAGDAARAEAEMEAFGAAYADPAVASQFPGYACWIAPAEEAAGHPDKADAAFEAGGRFVDCYRFRGDILDHRGDWAGAQKAYAASVAIAPDLPAGYYSWGVALARHGDLAGAQARLAGANARGPHWADPLKAWGDVLARQGRWSDALAKYGEALKYAPAWQALHQARDAAAHRLG